MSQQPEHDEIFVRSVEFERNNSLAFAIGNVFHDILKEMKKRRLSLVQHSVVAAPENNGVVLIVHGRKIDDFNDDVRGHVMQRYHDAWRCTRCGHIGTLSDANIRCDG